MSKISLTKIISKNVKVKKCLHLSLSFQKRSNVDLKCHFFNLVNFDESGLKNPKKNIKCFVKTYDDRKPWRKTNYWNELVLQVHSKGHILPPTIILFATYLRSGGMSLGVLIIT